LTGISQRIVLRQRNLGRNKWTSATLQCNRAYNALIYSRKKVKNPATRTKSRRSKEIYKRKLELKKVDKITV
jgi:hypothetical protein